MRVYTDQIAAAPEAQLHLPGIVPGHEVVQSQRSRYRVEPQLPLGDGDPDG